MNRLEQAEDTDAGERGVQRRRGKEELVGVAELG